MKGTWEERRRFLKWFCVIWMASFRVGGYGVFYFEGNPIHFVGNTLFLHRMWGLAVFAMCLLIPTLLWRRLLIEYAIQETLHDCTVVRNTVRSMQNFTNRCNFCTMMAGFVNFIVLYLPSTEVIRSTWCIIVYVLSTLGMIMTGCVWFKIARWERWRKKIQGLLKVPLDEVDGEKHYCPINDVPQYL